MPLVTGNLRDITNAPIPSKEPEILFSLNRANSAGGVLYPTQPVIVKPDDQGNFFVNLASTVDMIDTGFYQLQIRFLSPSALETTLMDFPDWKITVPREGGSISTLLAGHNPGNQRMVWVSQTPPLMPRPHMMWLEEDPANPAGSTGRLYEFRGGAWSPANGKGAWQYIGDLRGPAGYNAVGTEASQTSIAAWIKGTAGSNPVKTAVEDVLPKAKVNSQTFMPTANIVYKNNTSKAYRYEVIRVRCGGSPKPGVLGKMYASDFHLTSPKGDEFKAGPEVAETVQSFAARSGADIVFNSTGWDTLDRPTQYMVRGLQIKDGVMYRDFETTQRGMHALGVRADGSMAGYKVEDGWTGAAVLADGVINTFTFGPLLVHNGITQDIESMTGFSSLTTPGVFSGRQVLGHTQSGDILLISIVGVSADNTGTGGNELAALAKREGCYNAIMLDGGGSVQTVYNGITTHPSSDSSGFRTIGDCGTIFARCTQIPDSSNTQGVEPLVIDPAVALRSNGVYSPACVVRSGQVTLSGQLVPAGGGNWPAGSWIVVGSVPDKARPNVPVGSGLFASTSLGSIAGTAKVQIRAYGQMSINLSTPADSVDLSSISYAAF
jgi:hypothetical protein